MQWILIAATLLGGIAAIAYFWEKIWGRRKARHSGIYHCFILGWSYPLLTSTIISGKLPIESKQTLNLVKTSADRLGLNITTILKKTLSLDPSYSGKAVPALRREIQKKYGSKELAAFEMGFWLSTSPLLSGSDREEALKHVEVYGSTLGLSPNKLNQFVRRTKNITNEGAYIRQLQEFFSEIAAQLEMLEKINIGDAT